MSKPLKVRLLNIVEDQTVVKHREIDPVEGWNCKTEPFFLDGPVCRRVAVLDFDEQSGQLLPGAIFEPPGADRKLGRYLVDETNLSSRPFIQLSVFSTVLKTLAMFEEEDTLGREVQWAFGATQLLLVPVAGDRANAYYERASHSLQLFFFRPSRDVTVYTALSQDIVVHETTHAILDGLAPDLYNALTPESLALHEAIADLAAVIMSFRSNALNEALLRQTNGSIQGDTAFAWLAEEFGSHRDGSGRSGYLRSMWNERTFNPADPTLDANGESNVVSRNDRPHQLSQVLSGALYRIAFHLHEEYKQMRMAEKPELSEMSASGYALFRSTEHFQRLVFRALDYLPPGELSFTDYGRAILAADEASHPQNSIGRDILRTEFVRRAICTAADLVVATNFEDPAVTALDLQRLIDSDWAAYAFANQNRVLLGIPADADLQFRVRPRLESRKRFFLQSGETIIRECILKVSWDVIEPNPPGARLPARRQITVGSTLVIDWETRKIRALLTSHAADAASSEHAARRADRDGMLLRLSEEDRLQIDSDATFQRGVRVETSDGLMRIRGSARLLHIDN